ncbi:hypothetical protein ACI780_17540 [Geodermatophilus sp. SYSU D00814]
MKRSSTAVAAAVLALVAVPAAPALAAPPQVFPIEDEFADDFLTEECGVPVTTTATGQARLREFQRASGVVSVFTINVGLVATSEYGSVRFRDVGADLVRIEPDGTGYVQVSGQVPFDYNGVVRYDLETGEVVFQGGRPESTDRVCARLAP